jgi:hypothetical protein
MAIITPESTAVSIAGDGFVNINQQVFGTSAFADSTNGIFAIPWAGKWRLRYDLSTDGTGENANSQFAITDAANNIIAGSERTRGGGVTTSQILTAEVTVVTTGSANYKIRGRNGNTTNTGSTTILNSGTTDSTLSWTQIGAIVATQFQGANGTVAGAGGFVPTPIATDNVKFLRGDGTWAAIGGANPIAQVRVLPNTNAVSYTQAELQGVYDNQPGLAAPDAVPIEVSNFASALNTSGYKVYLGLNTWWYTNTASNISAANWTIFGGSKSAFGANIVPSGILTFK